MHICGAEISFGMRALKSYHSFENVIEIAHGTSYNKEGLYIAVQY